MRVHSLTDAGPRSTGRPSGALRPLAGLALATLTLAACGSGGGGGGGGGDA